MNSNNNAEINNFERKEFNFVHIKKSYKEAGFDNYSRYASIQAAQKDITNPETCSYEILDKPIRRLYLDIEGIESAEAHDHDIIKLIIRKYCDFINIPFDDANVKVTYNQNSTGHEGKSYHVIFPRIAMDYLLQKQVIKAFRIVYPEFRGYIDNSVYSVIRLFRLPYQCKQSENGLLRSDIHEVLNIFSVHEKYKLSDYLIQYVKTSRQIEFKDLPEKTCDVIVLYCRSIRSKPPLEKAIEESNEKTTANLNRLEERINNIEETNVKILAMLNELLMKHK